MTSYAVAGASVIGADAPDPLTTRATRPDRNVSRLSWMKRHADLGVSLEWDRMLTLLRPLELAPGMRVLQIGAGAGLLAVGISMVAGSRVTVVDIDEARAAEVTAGLAVKGLAEEVRVVPGDGYAGCEKAAPYDRIVSVVGGHGLSPLWTRQLAPGGGLIVAPVAFGPGHVLVRAVVGASGLVSGDVQPVPVSICWPDARGLLAPPQARSPLWPAWEFPAATVHRAALFPTDLSLEAYAGLGQYFAAATGRACTIGLADTDVSRGTLGLRTPDDTAVVVWRDGSVHATGPAAEDLAVRAQRLIHAWCTVSTPSSSDWAVTFRDHQDDSESPALLVPDTWRRTWPQNGGRS